MVWISCNTAPATRSAIGKLRRSELTSACDRSRQFRQSMLSSLQRLSTFPPEPPSRRAFVDTGDDALAPSHDALGVAGLIWDRRSFGFALGANGVANRRGIALRGQSRVSPERGLASIDPRATNSSYHSVRRGFIRPACVLDHRAHRVGRDPPTANAAPGSWRRARPLFARIGSAIRQPER